MAYELLIVPDGRETYRTVAVAGDEPLFTGVLETKETGAGPRPARYRVDTGDGPELVDPGEFADVARRATRIVVPAAADADRRDAAAALAGAYGADVVTAELCPTCVVDDDITRLDGDRGVSYGDRVVCMDCGLEELEREIAHRGADTDATVDRLAELLDRLGDVDRAAGVLRASLDPEVTRYDAVGPRSGDAAAVAVDALELPDALADRVPHDELLPVQAKSVDAGLLDGEDLLVVSATATGKTLVGELAGVERALAGGGAFVMVEPLVALARQKYDRLEERYGDVLDVTLKVGGNRLRDAGERFEPDADVVVATYEAVDHALRTGRGLGDVGTVVVDEVHEVFDGDRGHRVDGLIARLRHAVDPAQWIFLSATVAAPERLADALDARLVRYEDRPVPIERHLSFARGTEKPEMVSELVQRAYREESSKGYRGQSIVFTNSRKRCGRLADRIAAPAAAYHAGMTGGERSRVERRFGDGELAAVVTTAALAAGVDFPASQVIFERLAMGIEWLTVQDFLQMQGRAGRPEFHDEGRVYLLVEPDRVYHAGMERTEDEVAFQLLEGAMADEAIRYGRRQRAEQVLANAVVAGDDHRALADGMVGDLDVDRAVADLNDALLLRDEEPTALGAVAARHFLGIDEAALLLDAVEGGWSAEAIVAELVEHDPERDDAGLGRPLPDGA